MESFRCFCRLWLSVNTVHDVMANDAHVPGWGSSTCTIKFWAVYCWWYPACDISCISWRGPPKYSEAGRALATAYFTCIEVPGHTICCSKNTVWFPFAGDRGVLTGTQCWAAKPSLLTWQSPHRHSWNQGKWRQDLRQHHIRTHTTIWVPSHST